ncbi:Multitransmembrane protein [Handroanthus impetiginosus]|uniref:Bidirectional sugar transporter SWEET n=1 Tax=Handroanthus impetiginosus TaxID=429701 RepID=A0A2G9HQL6_9LAMI|nr:Multitransmembrane protein [Handroanthus impetiginosus]
MVYLGSLQTLVACKDAAGVAGNIFAFGLFLSPVPTFQRIIRNESTEQFSGLPYIYALLNCLITAWYGLPMISSDNLLVTTVNSVGAIFQIVYISIFIKYVEKTGQFKMIGLLFSVFVLFAFISLGSLLIVDFEVRHLTIGFISCASLISMFASPLFIINLVIRMRSVEFMPFHLSLSMFLMSTSFLLYGIFNFDPFIYVPNGIGTVLGVLQLLLFLYYKKPSRGDSTEPLIVSYTFTEA